MAFGDLVASMDRAALAVLGGTVLYAREFAGPVSVSGLFEATYRRTDIADAGAENAMPAVFCVLADLQAAVGDATYDPDGDTVIVTVGGTDYRVKEVKKDGMGGVILLLSEVF